MPESSTESERLRTRLLEQVREFELREQRWQALDQALRRALLRVSLAGGGLDLALDDQLDALREAVRGDPDPEQLNTLVEAIATTLRGLDEARRVPPAASPPLAPWLRQLAEAADAGVAASARRLLARLDADGGGSPEHWREAGALLGQALAVGGARESWWQRWRGKPVATAHAVADLPEQVQSTLIRLLSELPLPLEFEARRRQLGERVKAGLSSPALPDLLEDVAALVLESTREETQELEQFLTALTDRLTSIQSLLQADASARGQSDAAGSELDQAIREQVAGIQTSLRTVPDLEQLRSAVSRQLDGIIARMEEYRRAQDGQSEQARRREQELREQLARTEQEGERLRAALMAQRLRAQVDPLTEVANREAYNQRLAYEFARWQRHGHPLSLIVGDIDHFKQINDRFGHATGDKVLRSVARILQANMRATDFLARYGGEEFIVLMPDTTARQAAAAAEKLRLAVASRPFQAGAERVPVTISFGIAEFRDGDGTDAVFNRADKALYGAKDAGRNRVVDADTGS